MGIEAPLAVAFTFIYRAEDTASGLFEHEFDHVLIGQFEGSPRPNTNEVSDWKWTEPAEILRDLDVHPEKYTPWFKIVLERVLAHSAL